MLNEKKIKLIIAISLLLIDTFVWTVGNPALRWSADAVIGGADGPAVTVIAGGENGSHPEGEQPGEEGDVPGQSQGLYPPVDDPDSEQALREAAEKGVLILVNKENVIDRDYKPEDLTAIEYYAPDRMNSARYMRAEAAEAFHRLIGAAAEEGLEIKMTTAYRSYDFQKILFDNYAAREGEEKANIYSARPGESEHQTGLAVDVSSPAVNWQLSDDYGNMEEGKWLADNAWRFGFILRYLRGKEDITGYQYEPWHLRYVGLAAAEEIYEHDLTLEEFLALNSLETVKQ
jgi:D-alanyl-D-alanine carboxypeptidase